MLRTTTAPELHGRVALALLQGAVRGHGGGVVGAFESFEMLIFSVDANCQHSEVTHISR